MRTDPALLALLACPACSGALGVARVDRAEGDHVMDGALSCAGCRAQHAIVRGVPRFAPRPDAEHVARNIAGFGYQWTRGEAAMKDSRLVSAEVFLDFLAPLDAAWFAGKAVLDAGCGSGRFSRWACDFGAARVLALDYSDAVDVAFAALRDRAEALVVQGDLLHPPLAAGAFDHAFSVGVLHHTADPARAFAEVTARVRAGGAVSAWVYGLEGNEWIVRWVDPLRRAVFSRLPRAALWALSWAVALPLRVVLALVYVPARRVAPLRRRLFYFDYFSFFASFGLAEQALMIFDQLSPAIAAYVPRPEFERWFAAAGLESVRISARNGNSWRGLGARPARGVAT